MRIVCPDCQAVFEKRPGAAQQCPDCESEFDDGPSGTWAGCLLAGFGAVALGIIFFHLAAAICAAIGFSDFSFEAAMIAGLDVLLWYVIPQWISSTRERRTFSLPYLAFVAGLIVMMVVVDRHGAVTTAAAVILNSIVFGLMWSIHWNRREAAAATFQPPEPP